MRSRRVLWVLASAILSLLLVALIIRIGKIDLRLTFNQLRAVKGSVFVKLVLLYGVLIHLSDEKWRSTDAAVRRASDPVPSKSTSFAVTGAGMALGLVIPVQFGMTAARTLGMSFYGNTLKRGTAGTLFEQSFDLLTTVFLTVASVATWLLGGGGLMWLIVALGMIGLALLAAEPAVLLIRRLAACADSGEPHHGLGRAIRGRFSGLQHSGALNAALARRLVVFSSARFAAVVLGAGLTAEAIDAPIPLWRLAAAMPLVVLACVIAVTPGGLGVNELTSASVLSILGTPFSIGARWAVANRVLGLGACFLAAALAAAIPGIKRLVTRSK